jgi:aminoglycoside phosphotransferase (APT) family kinase protein
MNQDNEALVARETIEMRADERLDMERLEAWLRANLSDADGPMSARQFGGGHANLTYLVTIGPRELVVRRPPLGPVAPGSHDMKREHRVLSVLWRKFALAPRSFAICEDESVIGAVFHVLERRRGFAVRADLPEGLRDPALTRRIGWMMVDTLADLHRVDAAAIGLNTLGRPQGFMRRQVEGWTRRWQAARDRELPQMERLSSWLLERVPEPPAATLLHLDFKLDNILLDPDDPSRPVAVLDWDMTTIGDPLADLGQLLAYWSEVGDPAPWREASLMPTWREGFPTRSEVASRYAERTGTDISAIDWYHTFGVFKLAVVLQQIYIRYVRGQTQDERFVKFGTSVLALAGKAAALARI